VIKESEAKKQQQINEAQGEAAAILSVAEATAEGIRKVAESIQMAGGYEAVQLRVAEQYINQFGNLAKKGTALIVPATLTDITGFIATAMTAVRQAPAAADGDVPQERGRGPGVRI
jgi:regulator of protease activity HflC (stomatin/prohibitin superfamily)